MKILQINKFLFLNGGISRYFFEISKLLSKKSHKIAYFSMSDKKNIKTRWDKYFVSNISYEKVRIKDGIRILSRMLYSFEARKKISQLLNTYKTDVAHLHDISHYISSSILLELKKRNIPVVQSIHNFHCISPNYNMFHNGEICEITKPNNYYKAIFHKCVKNSYLASITEVIEKYVHYFTGWDRGYIDYFIAPSKFTEKKLIEYGLDRKKIIYLPHFLNTQEYKPNFNIGNYILYFGRLSPEKGINYLIKALSYLPNIKLIIAGRGNIDYEEKLKSQSSKLNNVEFVGFQDNFKLKKLIGNCRFTILPSVWYEVFGLSILESFAFGKPVIASDIGGIPDTVKDGYNGLLVKPGNVNDLIEKMNKLWNNLSFCRKLGRNAREHVETYFRPEKHYEKLMAIYKKAITLNQ